MEPGETLLFIFSIGAIVSTLYLRKDLEEHGLHLWVYASVPFFGAMAMSLVFIDELTPNVAEFLFYGFGCLSMLMMLLGTIIASRMGSN